MMMIFSQEGPVPAAGAFTTNRVKGAPLLVTQEHIKGGRLGAVVTNSGISNVYTGKRGLRDAYRMAQLTAELLGFRRTEVGVASTGLIGSYLPMRKIEAGIRTLVQELSSSREASLNAARAIMTTDTVPKEVALRVNLKDGTPVTIAGIAKGAGMICPELKTATMLAFLVTDAAINPSMLKVALGEAVDRSFNMLNVDRDTSTSDMVLIMANGRAKNRRITRGRPDERFEVGLTRALEELARMIANDGEGASRFIEVEVRNARNLEEARRAAKAVAGSNLVKAAVFGRDPNWGRIVAALGYSGARFDPFELSLELMSERGKVELVRRGRLPPKRVLARAKDIMRGKEIGIHIDLRAGKERARAWGCDLTYDYVRINSKYTT
jgi:glutamate N-acetyltransferase/amino-acid N-acetyltransferase